MTRLCPVACWASAKFFIRLCAVACWASGKFYISAARIIRTISVSLRDPTTRSLPSVADPPHPFSFDQCGARYIRWQYSASARLPLPRSHPRNRQSRKKIFKDFLETEYGVPGTLLVEPFAGMLLGLKLNKLPGAAVAARAALLRGQNYLDQDWEIWNFQQSH